MRFTHLLLVCFVVTAIAVSAFAAGPDQNASVSAKTVDSQRVQTIRPDIQINSPLKPDGSTIQDSALHGWNSGKIAIGNWKLMDDETCYAMRTYRVERVDRTEATRAAGYTTCLPGRSVQMKSAIGQRK